MIRSVFNMLRSVSPTSTNDSEEEKIKVLPFSSVEALYPRRSSRIKTLPRPDYGTDDIVPKLASLSSSNKRKLSYASDNENDNYAIVPTKKKSKKVVTFVEPVKKRRRRRRMSPKYVSLSDLKNDENSLSTKKSAKLIPKVIQVNNVKKEVVADQELDFDQVLEIFNERATDMEGLESNYSESEKKHGLEK